MGADGFEEAESPGGDDVSCIIRNLKGNSDVGLGGEVVNLVGVDCIEPAAERGGVSEVSVMELHLGFMGIVGIDVDMVDALGIEVGGSSDEAVDFVASGEEEFGQVGAVLTSYAGDQGYFPACGGSKSCGRRGGFIAVGGVGKSGSGGGLVVGGHLWQTND